MAENTDKRTETEENENEPKTVTLVAEKPGVLKRVWNTVTAPARWCGKKMKESPAATGIGMIIGGLLSLGAKEGIKYIVGHKTPDFIPADMPEIKIDDPIPTTFDND